MMTAILNFFGFRIPQPQQHERAVTEVHNALADIEKGKEKLEQSIEAQRKVSHDTRNELTRAEQNRNAIKDLLRATRFRDSRR